MVYCVDCSAHVVEDSEAAAIAAWNRREPSEMAECAAFSAGYEAGIDATLRDHLIRAKSAADDALGVFLLGIPMSSLTGGDKAGDIATSKGKIAALEARAATCRGA